METETEHTIMTCKNCLSEYSVTYSRCPVRDGYPGYECVVCGDMLISSQSVKTYDYEITLVCNMWERNQTSEDAEA